jgi:hypothetical protein
MRSQSNTGAPGFAVIAMAAAVVCFAMPCPRCRNGQESRATGPRDPPAAVLSDIEQTTP